MMLVPAAILKGVARVSGDGFKDTTVKGDVVFVYAEPLPAPHGPGQYERIGFSGWTASSDMFDFKPTTRTEIKALINSLLPASKRSR